MFASAGDMPTTTLGMAPRWAMSAGEQAKGRSSPVEVETLVLQLKTAPVRGSGAPDDAVSTRRAKEVEEERLQQAGDPLVLKDVEFVFGRPLGDAWHVRRRWQHADEDVGMAPQPTRPRSGGSGGVPHSPRGGTGPH